MPSTVGECIRKLRSDTKWLSYNENKIVHVAILPILESIGWNIENEQEVYGPFKIGNNQIDIKLSARPKKYIIVEAKRYKGINLKDHKHQLHNYAFSSGAEIAVLTNGARWMAFLSFVSGVPWDSRHFLDIDILKDDVAKATHLLKSLLGKKSYLEGTSIQRAQDLMEERVSKAPPIRSRPKNRDYSEEARLRAIRSTAPGDQTKTKQVYDALCNRWCTGAELTALTGQGGGWQKYVYNIYVANVKYDDVVLLTRRVPGVRAQQMRLVPRDRSPHYLEDSSVETYKPA